MARNTGCRKISIICIILQLGDTLNLQVYIRIFSAAFLLCVFAMGITPKQVIHDALTSHNHIEGNKKNVPSVNKDRFNCDDQHFDAELPFVDPSYSFELTFRTIFQRRESLFIYSFNSFQHFFYELRGPPSLV